MGRALEYLRDLFSRRQTRYGLNTALALFLFLVIVVVVEALAIRHNARVDLTEGRRHTLSDQSIKLLESLENEVHAVAFYHTDQPGKAGAEVLLGQYAHFSPQFSYEFVDPDRRPGLARRYGITTYGTIVLESGGKEQKVTLAEEEKITNALVKLRREGRRVIYFLTGHGEADLESAEAKGISQVKQALTEVAYEVKPLLLLREKEVPRDAAVLVIAGPIKDLLPTELEAVEAYVKRGGKVLVLLDPFAAPGLSDLLKKYGLIMGADVILDRLSRVLGGDFYTPVVTQYEDHPITKDFNIASFFPFARTVDAADEPPPGITAQVLGRTSPESWAETDRKGIERGEAPFFDEEKDRKGPVPVGAVATLEIIFDDEGPESGLEKKGRIVAYGTSGFVRNTYLNLSGNRDLFLNSVSWLAEEEDLIAIRPRQAKFTPLVLTASQGQIAFWGTLVLPPLAIIGTWIVVAFRRRRSA